MQCSVAMPPLVVEDISKSSPSVVATGAMANARSVPKMYRCMVDRFLVVLLPNLELFESVMYWAFYNCQ